MVMKESMMMELIHAFTAGFVQGVRGTWKFGFFAPLTAAILVVSQRAGYFMHLRALHRLANWR
jgi:hypothetical protein